MKKILIIITTIILMVSWSLLSAGPDDTEAEEEVIKIEFMIWLNNSTIKDINYSDVDIIVELNDDDYIRNVMHCYVMPFPSGDLWYDFCIEYGFIGIE